MKMFHLNVKHQHRLTVLVFRKAGYERGFHFLMRSYLKLLGYNRFRYIKTLSLSIYNKKFLIVMGIIDNLIINKYNVGVGPTIDGWWQYNE